MCAGTISTIGTLAPLAPLALLTPYNNIGDKSQGDISPIFFWQLYTFRPRRFYMNCFGF